MVAIVAFEAAQKVAHAVHASLPNPLKYPAGHSWHCIDVAEQHFYANTEQGVDLAPILGDCMTAAIPATCTIATLR